MHSIVPLQVSLILRSTDGTNLESPAHVKGLEPGEGCEARDPLVRDGLTLADIEADKEAQPRDGMQHRVVDLCVFGEGGGRAGAASLDPRKNLPNGLRGRGGGQGGNRGTSAHTA